MGRKIKDMSGKRFGRLFVVSFNRTDGGGRTYWNCICDCGNEKVVSRDHLQTGGVSSCGCWWREGISWRNKTHGMTKTKIFSVFHGIKNRCSKKDIRHKDYKHYSSKGIKCERTSFEEFRDDMYEGYLKHIEEFGERNTQLDRKDSSLNYNKQNCRWVTIKENVDNRECTRKINYMGKIYNMVELAKYLGLPRSTLYNKIKRGEIII